jgi:hypothetical protein
MTQQKGVFADSNTALAKISEIMAAADFLGNGAIEVNRYESEIYDVVARTSVFLNRVDSRPATGHPHRYFEETAIGTATFTDPRNIAPNPTGPTRVEQAAFIKAITAQTNMSLFDVDVTRQQGQYSFLESKDIQDAVNAIVRLEAAAVWNGSDTSLSSPTTTQYMGVLNQITQTATIASGASIIDGLKAAVAAMVARTDYDIAPSAIYVNPILGDYIDREAKAMKIEIGEMEVVAGVKVKTINTQAGVLPLISDRWLPRSSGSGFGFSAPPAGLNNYFAVILTEKAVEMPFIAGGDGNPKPRIFQLGLLSGLQGQYVAIHFNAVLAKGPSYSHQTVCVVRP